MNKKYFYIMSIQIFWLITSVSAQTIDTVLTLLHVTDTHICNLEGYEPGFVKVRQEYANGFTPFEKFLKTIPTKVNADAVVLTGDAIDYYEAKTIQDNLQAGQIDYFLPLLKMSPVPLFLLMGNHDVSSYWMVNDSIRIKSQFNSMEARSAWIRDFQLFEKGTYYSKDYQVGLTGYRLIFLDISFKTKDAFRGYWDEPQLEWLRMQLKNSVDKKIVLFFHIPLPVGDTNQDGVHFKTPPDGWPFADSYDNGIFEILNQYPNVISAFVGHGHHNVVEDIPFPEGHSVTQVQTGAFGEDPSNWRIIRITEKMISISLPGLETIEKNIEWEK